MQRRLIPFHGETGVRVLRHDPLRDFGLATHRVDRHQRAGNLDEFQQVRDRRDFIALTFIALGVRHHLSQADVVRRGPSADHVNRRLAAGRVEAAPERLAVDGDDLSAGDFRAAP